MKTKVPFSHDWQVRRNVVPVIGTLKLSGLPALLLASILLIAPESSEAGVIEAWVRRYDGLMSGSDHARVVTLDAQNNLIVTGTSWNGPIQDAYTAKYAAADGAILWDRRYNEPRNSSQEPAAVVLDNQGNVIVTGTSYSSNATFHFTLKYASSDGALLWQKMGPRGSIEAAAVLPAGDIVLAGVANSGTNNVAGTSDGTNAWYIARYGSLDGTLIWENRGPEGYVQALAVDAVGNVVTCGSVSFPGDFYTVKYRGSDGTVLWDKRYNAGVTDRATALAVDPEGNVAITGLTGNGSDSDFYTAKYRAADGLLLWERRYSGPLDGYDVPRALAVDRHGNVIVTGSYWNGTNPVASIVKYAASNGVLLWERGWPEGWGAAVAVDNGDNILVAGSSYAGRYTDYHTAKYATDGAVI
jgi:hypothetical protein